MIRLSELRAEKGLSQREIAKVMNISQGTYNNWENEKTQPCIEQLIALSTFFGVSVDYLVGNTDEYGTIKAADSISTEQRVLLTRFGALSQPAKDALLAFLENVE